jgi:hypothetical protein
VLSLRDISDKACHLTDEFGIISIVPKSQILEQSKAIVIFRNGLKNSIIPL